MPASNENPLGPGGAKMVDDEHRVQVELIEALEAALESDGRGNETEEVLGQFREFTRMHFLSEDLLMRLHAYPQYEVHLAEHQRLLEALDDLEQAVAGGESGAALERVRSYKNTLLSHIADQDTELTRFMSER